MLGSQHSGPVRASKFRVLSYNTTTPPEALRATIALIGKGIKDGGRYIPIRMHAAKVASRATPKDYLGQVQAIYDDFVKRWRYVMDPLTTEMVTIGGPQIFEQVIGLAARPGDHGYGDCDDATIALGALLRGVGFEVAINTMEKPTPPGAPQGLFSHVFPTVKIPGRGWLTVDAVGHPRHKLGWTPPHQRLAVWDLEGNLLATRGQFPPVFKQMLTADISGITGRPQKQQGVRKMSLQGIDMQNDFPDYDLSRYGLAGTDDREPVDWSTHAALGFGAYVDRPVPIVDNENMGLVMEYDDSDIVAFNGIGEPLVRTKMLEMDPFEVAYALRHGTPRPNAVALSDDGEVYKWTVTPMGGFFAKLFTKVKNVVKKVKGGIKKGIRWVGSKAKALIKKLPGGKYLLKVYDKVKKIGMKLVKPLMKIVGPLAKRIAPLAALIPGYGVAISAALYKVGAMSDTLKKYKVKLDKMGRPKFSSGKQAKLVKKSLERKAAKMRQKKKKKKRRGKKRDMRELIARKVAKREAKIRRELEKKYRRQPRLIAPAPPPTQQGYDEPWYYN